MTGVSKDVLLTPIEPAPYCFEADDVLVRVWKVAHELGEGRLALFDATQSELVIINPLGAEFWSHLDGLRSLGEIAGEIAAGVQSAPEPAQVLAQSAPFLSDLMRRGAIAAR